MRNTMIWRTGLGLVLMAAGLLHSLYYVTGMIGGWEESGWNLLMAAAGIGLALVGAWVWRNRHRTFTGRKLTLLKLARVTLLAGIAVFVLLEGLIIAGGRSTEPRQSELVLILGARVKGDTVSLSLKERLDQGLAYWRLYPSTPIMVSGGQGPGENMTEAEAMKRYLVAGGVPESQIYMEDRSHDTFQNMTYSAQLMRAKGLKPDAIRVTVITNDFHMLRSKLLASRAGLEQVYGYPSATPPYTLPRMMTRECAALLNSWLFDR